MPVLQADRRTATAPGSPASLAERVCRVECLRLTAFEQDGFDCAWGTTERGPVKRLAFGGGEARGWPSAAVIFGDENFDPEGMKPVRRFGFLGVALR